MENGEFILKAEIEIGDFLYVIIFVILMLVGIWEKITKSKQQPLPLPEPSHDDFEDVEEEEFVVVERQMTPNTYYQPIVCEIGGTLSDNKFAQNQIQPEEEKETGKVLDFEFDIRQAVIASEILNRKY